MCADTTGVPTYPPGPVAGYRRLSKRYPPNRTDYEQGRRTGLVETSRARRRCKSPDPPPKWARLEARKRAEVEEEEDARPR